MRTRHLLAMLAAAIATGTGHAETSTYQIDPTHTFVTFEVVHFGTSTNRGRFDRKAGSVSLDKAAKVGHAELTLEAASIDTGTPGFDKHLLGDNFLNAAIFPAARFISDNFTFNADQVSQVEGQLTLLGKTNPVVLRATKFNCYMNPLLKREVCGGDFEATIQRSQWGMNWGIDLGVPDVVKLVIQVEAIKQ